jgi:hypothetical protein
MPPAMTSASAVAKSSLGCGKFPGGRTARQELH